VVKKLANELLESNSPTALAAIAASNIIYIDALTAQLRESGKAHKSKDQVILALDEASEVMKGELVQKLSVKEVANISAQILASYRKAKWGKGGSARAKNYYHKDSAIADWEKEGCKFSSARAFARQSFLKYGATDPDT